MPLKHATILFVITWLIATAGCSPAVEPTPTAQPAPEITLDTTGSGSTTTVIAAVAAAFETDTAGYHLNTMIGSGSGGGIQGVIDEVIDVAAVARPPKDDEMAAEPDLVYVEFGQGAVALFAHSTVGITNLTKEQATAILAGEITNWSAVEGPDEAILLFVRDEADTSTKALRNDFFGETAFAEDAQIITNQTDMENSVAGTEYSLGFGSWPSAKAAGAAVEGIALDGVSPDDSAYTMVKPVGLVYLAARQNDIQPLVDWLLSDNGRITLHEYGVIVAD